METVFGLLVGLYVFAGILSGVALFRLTTHDDAIRDTRSVLRVGALLGLGVPFWPLAWILILLNP